MPRYARRASESGIYHIVLRGINKQVIFEDDEDREKFLKTIMHYKSISRYELYGYCLMDNHIHLLIKEAAEPISLVIKRISSSYVYWYNRKYERCGHLFQERFKSEVVESEAYFLTVLRYIHQNPIKAGLTKNIEEYQWSSINEYEKNQSQINTDFALKMIFEDKAKAVELLRQYMNEHTEDNCIDYEEKNRVSDQAVISNLVGYGISSINELKKIEISKRNKIIRAVKVIDGVTIRQLSRITGISKSVIDRI